MPRVGFIYGYKIMDILKSSSPLSYPQFCQAIRRERANYERKCKRLQIQLSAFQAAHKHDSTLFYEDAAGGNDSYYACLRCNLQL